jgi:adenylate kinase family enzyme
MARIVGRYDRVVASAIVAQLPCDARRVVVRGSSGSGKTTMARRISTALDVPHVELDGVFHQPEWTPLSDEAFVASVAAVAAEDAWVVCGNYRRVADLLVDRADTAVLFDLPRWIVMSRIVRRTLGRIVRHEELWNGNRERWRNFFTLDPEESVIVFAWKKHAARHEWVAEFLAHPPHDGLRMLRIASRSDERMVYAGLSVPVGV